MSRVALNSEQKLYVISHEGGYSSLGFQNAHDHAEQIALRLNRPDLAFDASDYGSPSGYGKYQAAVQAWGQSDCRRRTYFEPGTDPKAAEILEECRKLGRTVRLIYGDTATGRTWLDEHNVIGRIGRSMGPLKVPLLIAPAADSGAAILTANLLALVEWHSRALLFRHAMYQPAELSMTQAHKASHCWEVRRDEEVVARFDGLGKAAAYVAFMCGETVDPAIFR